MGIQSLVALISNANFKGFFTGKIYTGAGKNVCVPGLNCYSCPGALGACPLGSLQSFLSGLKFRFPYYVLGLLLFFGALLGRAVCGFLCPFGFLQDLLYLIPFYKKNRFFYEADVRNTGSQKLLNKFRHENGETDRFTTESGKYLELMGSMIEV